MTREEAIELVIKDFASAVRHGNGVPMRDWSHTRSYIEGRLLGACEIFLASPGTAGSMALMNLAAAAGKLTVEMLVEGE